MKHPSRGVVIMAIAGFVALAGVAPFCPPAQAHAMPCCDAPDSHCGASLRATSCCRVEPGSMTPMAPGARLVPPPGPLAIDLMAMSLPRPVLYAASSSMLDGLPNLRDPVPLFLLNASLLR